MEERKEMQQSPVKKSNHNNRLLIGIITGIVSGALLGGFWPEGGLTVKFVGDLFIRFLMMIVMPLIVAAMVSGIARLGDIRKLGSLGTRTLGYYIGTTALSVLTGILLVLWIQPGKSGLEHSKKSITYAEAHYRINGNTIQMDAATLPDSDFTSSTLHLMDKNLSASIDSVQRSGEMIAITVSEWKKRAEVVTPPEGEGTGIRLDRQPDTRFMQEKRAIGDILKEVVSGLVPSNIFKAMANNEILPVITFSL
ncbi:MAG TPA: cation:dicarboxylase symporter family transporter, partial [Chlorobaculum parvum]|nr:cation:dicarboxylase symporter family transporter [Chlorobaculum parvum]